MEENKNTTSNTDTNAKSGKLSKALSIVFDVMLYIFLALALFVLLISVMSDKNNGARNVFGYEMRIVVSPSMEKSQYSADVSQYKIKSIKTKSMVFIERVPEDEQKAAEWYADLAVGDVLTFAYVGYSSPVTQDVITHRITEIVPTENGYKITLKGDNRADGDSEVKPQIIYTSASDYVDSGDSYNYVIGKVVGQSVVLGHIVYSVGTPVGVALIVILPCSLIMIWQIVRIVNVVNEDRRQKAAAQAESQAAEQQKQSLKQARELEELKRKIAELEQQNKQNNEGDNDTRD